MNSVYWADDIYRRLGDSESRKIFENRILYSCTGDFSFIENIVQGFEERKELLRIEENRKKYIFGGGTYGYYIQRCYPLGWDGIVDNNRDIWGEKCGGIEVSDPEKMERDAVVVIANRYHHSEIKEQLLEMGFAEKDIVNTGQKIDRRGNRQYFDFECLKNNGNEVFVDVGALNGSSAIFFARWAGDYKHIYCMEPDPTNAEDTFNNLHEKLDKERITVIRKAAGKVNKKSFFKFSQNGNSAITEEWQTVGRFIMNGIIKQNEMSDIEVEVARIDDEIRDEVSFIKMDIEGSEMDACMGASRTIKEYHPKLAISIYHKANDVIDIPKYILECDESYRFYLRHYSIFPNETILYAI